MRVARHIEVRIIRRSIRAITIILIEPRKSLRHDERSNKRATYECSAAAPQQEHMARWEQWAEEGLTGGERSSIHTTRFEYNSRRHLQHSDTTRHTHTFWASLRCLALQLLLTLLISEHFSAECRDAPESRVECHAATALHWHLK